MHKVNRCMVIGPLLLLALTLISQPAFSQVDLSGEWTNIAHEDQLDRRSGPDLGDYTGLPINDAARLRAESWDAGILSIPEWQCRPHPADYITLGPSTLRIWKDLVPINRQLIAWRMEWLRSKDRTIYMDGRPHPSADALHTWTGFSTGKWEGDILTITTTHLKEGYLRRNGIPRSDLATMTERVIRHGDYLQWITIINDPVYLTEPLIRTTEYVLAPRQQLSPNPCSGIDVGLEVNYPKGFVPHFLPGTNTNLSEFLSLRATPDYGARGGADTLYPERRSPFRASTTAVPANTAAPSESTDVQVRPVRGNIYMLSGAGGNITVLLYPDGVLLVDAGRASMTDKVLAAIRRLSDKPIRALINTSVVEDHTGGNANIAEAGSTITGGTVSADAGQTAEVIAHENVLARMSLRNGNAPPVAPHALPTVTYYADRKKLSPSIHGEGIQIIHQPAALTDGDSIVHFRGSDVISAGDVFMTTGYPLIDLEKGGSIQGTLDALNYILDLAIPDYWMEGGTLVIPGHGRISDSADVAYYRDMLTIIRDRVADMIQKGMSLEQVKAARPSRDYDPRYGTDAGPWTTSMFIEAVYQSLSENK